MELTEGPTLTAVVGQSLSKLQNAALETPAQPACDLPAPGTWGYSFICPPWRTSLCVHLLLGLFHFYKVKEVGGEGIMRKEHDLWDQKLLTLSYLKKPLDWDFGELSSFPDYVPFFKALSKGPCPSVSHAGPSPDPTPPRARSLLPQAGPDLSLRHREEPLSATFSSPPPATI